jgi:hypothetical protein
MDTRERNGNFISQPGRSRVIQRMSTSEAFVSLLLFMCPLQLPVVFWIETVMSLLE